MKVTVKKSPVLLFCLQTTAGAQAPAWKGSLPPHGRGLLKAVPCFPISVPSLFLTSFLPQLFPLPATPLWSTGFCVFLGRGGHSVMVVCVTPSRRAALPWPATVHGQAVALRPGSCCRHTSQSDGSLLISNAKPEDAGTYMCLGSDRRTESRQVRLQITGDFSSALLPKRYLRAAR